eukprot:COSAG06_NODE_15272_length_1084_cov_1.884264_1_plen_95_part_10
MCVSEAAATNGVRLTAATRLNSLTVTAANKKQRREGSAVLSIAMCVCAVLAVRVWRSVLSECSRTGQDIVKAPRRAGSHIQRRDSPAKLIHAPVT